MTPITRFILRVVPVVCLPWAAVHVLFALGETPPLTTPPQRSTFAPTVTPHVGPAVHHLPNPLPEPLPPPDLYRSASFLPDDRVVIAEGIRRDRPAKVLTSDQREIARLRVWIEGRERVIDRLAGEVMQLRDDRVRLERELAEMRKGGGK